MTLKPYDETTFEERKRMRDKLMDPDRSDRNDELYEHGVKTGDIQHKGAHFRPAHGRGFSHSAMHKAAEELRMKGHGSEDPMYPDKHKNK